MGNSFSNGNNLFIYVDRPYYSPGDPINGQVLLNCVQPFQASALVLKVEGYESARWEEKIENSSYDDDRKEWNNTSELRPYASTKDFFKIKIPLQSYPHQVQPGQYQFPFTVVLPTNLPGSFEYNDNNVVYQGNYHNYIKAKIRYKLKAECEVPGLVKPNLRFKQHILVHERIARPPSEVVAENNQTVKACCCCTKGFAYISAHVEKDSYFPGEVANVLLQVDNQSSAEFTSVDLTLRRIINLKSDGAGFHESDEEMAKCSLPGVKAGEQLLKEATRRLSLQLPQQMQASANGHIVQCQYVLEVKLKASAFMSDPSVKLPIMIFQAIPPFQAYAAPPPYWSPEAVPPPVEVAMPSAPPLPPQGQVMGTYVPPQPTYAGKQ